MIFITQLMLNTMLAPLAILAQLAYLAIFSVTVDDTERNARTINNSNIVSFLA